LCLTVNIYKDLFEVEEEMRGAVSWDKYLAC
jgi:hypothetical protein